jgi:hypothetical protein
MERFFDRNLTGILWVGYTLCVIFILCGVYGA